jgi:hypothetical protein
VRGQRRPDARPPAPSGAQLDYLENLSTFLVMVRCRDQTAVVDLLAPVFTAFTWGFLGASFILLLGGMVIAASRWMKRRGVGTTFGSGERITIMLVLVWSAMRHFAEVLRDLGYTGDYYRVQQELGSPLMAHIKKHGPTRICCAGAGLGAPAHRTSIGCAGASLPSPTRPLHSTSALLIR